MKPNRRNPILLSALATVFVAQSASAVDFYWDGGTNNWTTASAWSTTAAGTTNPGAAPGSADDLFFNITSANTTANAISHSNGNRAARSLTFNTTGTSNFRAGGASTAASTLTIGVGGITMNANAGAVTLGQTPGTYGTMTVALGGAQSWTNNGAGLLTITGGVTNGANLLTIAGSGNTTIQGVIGNGSGGITKNGNGALTLSGTNTYTGTTTLNAGTLNLNNTRAVGGQLTINGGKIDTTNATAGLSVLNNTQVWGGNFEFVGTSSFNLGTGTVNLNAGTRTVTTTANTLTVGGIISNGGLTKDGAGNLRINGANTFAGTTIVNNGKLQIGNYSGLDNTSSITIANGGTSGIDFVQVGTGTTTNTINKDVSLHGRMAITGGTSSNRLNLTWDGNITLAGDSTITNNGNSLWDINGQIDLGTHTLTYQADGTGSRIDGNIIGTTGSLNKTNAQSLTLTGTNTYGGTTTLTGGALVTALPANLAGYTNAGKVIFNGGRLDVTMGEGSTTGWSTAQVDTLLANATKTSGNLGINTANGDLTQWTAFDSATNFGGINLIKLGANTLTLDQANNLAATTIASGGGTLRITTPAALGSGSVTVSTAGANSGTLELALTGTNTINNTFNGFASANALSGGNAAQIRNTSGDNTITSNLTITGTGGSGLNVASDGGLLTLSGTITANVSAGARTFSVGGSGGGVVSGAILDDTTNTLALAVQKSGPGTWTFSNPGNAYSGATTILNGTLKLGANDVMPDASAVTIGGGATSGTFDLAGFSDTIANTVTLGAGTTTLGGQQNQIVNTGGNAVLAVDGGITYNAGSIGFENGTALISANLQLGVTTGTNRNINVGNGADAVDLEITGILSSSAGGNPITKTGLGTLFLNNDANTHSHQFLVDAGTVRVTKLADVNNPSSLGTGALADFIRLGNNDTATLEYVGTTDSSTDRSIQIGTSGATNTGNGAILNNSATGKLTFTGTNFNPTVAGITVDRTVTLGGSNALDNTISGKIQDNDTANGGTISVAKQGSGTWILAGNNTYTGATTVTGGVLVVNGSLANTTTTVGNNATLRGSGSIGGSVTVQSGGTLAAGNSIESLGTGALSFEANSTFAYELQTDLYGTTPGVAGDLTYSTGTLDISAGAILTLTDLATSTALAIGSKFTLISYFGGWTSTELFTYGSNTLADGSTFTLGANDWLFNYDDTSGGLNYNGDQIGASSFVTMTVVPEPNVAALLGGLGVLLLRRRR
jgi:autotransporter-associated beta strand protein